MQGITVCNWSAKNYYFRYTFKRFGMHLIISQKKIIKKFFLGVIFRFFGKKNFQTPKFFLWNFHKTTKLSSYSDRAWSISQKIPVFKKLVIWKGSQFLKKLKKIRPVGTPPFFELKQIAKIFSKWYSEYNEEVEEL